MTLMMIMLTKPYDYDDPDDNNDHKHDSYTAAGAAPGASVPRSLFLVIFGPEPDSAPYDFFLTTNHRSSKNLFFENLYKSLFSQAKTSPGTPRTRPDHPHMIPRNPKNRPKIGQTSTHVDSFSYMNLSWVL